jgi:hypothetical protein
MPSRIAWVVKTPNGWLGQRRYDYGAGTSAASAKADFRFARVFSREADARRSLEPGDEVVPVTITT